MSQLDVSLVDLNRFKSLGDITLPFNLKVDAFVKDSLECTEVFRFLPEKRLVCKARYQGRDVVAKIFFGVGFKKRAKREIEGLQRVKNVAISTPKIVSFIEDDVAKYALIIFEFIEYSITLGECLNESNTSNERIAVFEKALLFIADMHESSIYQQDVHLDNFLYDNNSLYLIDGDQVKEKKGINGLDERLAISNLAMFFTQLYQWENKQIGRLLAIYLKARATECAVNLSSVIKQLNVYRDWREKKYVEKKVFRQCGAFDVVKNWHTFCVFSRDFSKNNALNIIKNADALIDKGEVLKSGRTATVVKIYMGDKPYILKRYNKKNWLHYIGRCLMESRSAVSWRSGHLLTFNAIPTAKPLLILENRWGVLRGRSYIVTEYIKGVHVFDYFNLPDELENKKVLAMKVSELVNHLHQCGFSHGDLKPQNIWVAEGLPILIDLDGMKKVSSGGEAKFSKDWARLNKSIKEATDVVPYIDKFGVDELVISISIIIPTYNYGTRVVAAVESVLRQMGDIDELIVIDDGSTDNTQVALEALSAKKLNKFSVFVQKNGGASAARNSGIQKSSGNYLLFLDSDDELEAGALEKYREAVRLDRGVELFLAGHISVEESGHKKEHLVTRLSNKKADNVRAYWRKKIPMCHGAFLVKKEVLYNISYPENLRSGEDISVFTHLLANCQTSLIKGTVVIVRKHVDSLRNIGVKDKKSVECLVDSVFNAKFLPQRFDRYKQRFLAERMLSLSREMFASGYMSEGRSTYWKALRLEPVLLLKWNYFRKYIKSFFEKV